MFRVPPGCSPERRRCRGPAGPAHSEGRWADRAGRFAGRRPRGPALRPCRFAPGRLLEGDETERSGAHSVSLDPSAAEGRSAPKTAGRENRGRPPPGTSARRTSRARGADSGVADSQRSSRKMGPSVRAGHRRARQTGDSSKRGPLPAAALRARLRTGTGSRRRRSRPRLPSPHRRLLPGRAAPPHSPGELLRLRAGDLPGDLRRRRLDPGARAASARRTAEPLPGGRGAGVSTLYGDLRAFDAVCRSEAGPGGREHRRDGLRPGAGGAGAPGRLR